MQTGDRFEKLITIMAKLRSEDGCPWDKEQTHQTLRQYLLEETYEVLECLDANDVAELALELGDLLLQVIFHAQIAAENRNFTIDDVIGNITTKLIDRHPHVFGDQTIDSLDAQEKNWERLKKKEGKKSALDGVPKAMPALARACRLQQKAAAVGFDWDNANGVLDKTDEELKELREAVSRGRQKEIEEEYGDMLFALANLGRFINVHPEDAMRQTISKFIFRFQFIEKHFEEQGRELHNVSIDEMEKIWQLAKTSRAEK